MCGIFGTINFRVQDKQAVLKALRHRGPDEQNIVQAGPVEWYHTRLAIQDLSPAGRQPMQHAGVYITFNGEIYNHLELRDRYRLEHPSRSDTMTILLLYEKLGMDMLAEFDGMFAMGIYDGNRGKVYLARDRAGEKPMYIWSDKESLVFSSELNAMRSVLPLRIRENAIAAYLYLGYHHGSNTPYRDVMEVEPGTFLEIEPTTGERQSKRWFDISRYYLAETPMDEADAMRELEERLHLSVRRRIDSSDLEVGAFLSGGIDSGLVTAIAATCTQNLRTFTVKLPGAYDESELAATVADRYRTRHTTIPISFDNLKTDFVHIIAGYGEPFFDSSAIPGYYVSKEAKQHITVVLNGDGADELFGGYRRYVPFRYADFFKQSVLTRRIAGGLAGLLPVANEKKSRYSFLYRLVQFASSGRLTDLYGSATTDLFVGFSRELSHEPDLSTLADTLSAIRGQHLSPLRKMLLADFQILLPGDLLPKMDIATMAFSLEGRSPFLGKEILEFAPGLADMYKIKGVTTKYLLRKLAEKYLPAVLINQPKRGFEVPLKRWMDEELRELAGDYLSGSAGALYPEYLRVGFVRDLLDRRVAVSDEKRARMLYALLCLEVWHRDVYKAGH